MYQDIAVARGTTYDTLNKRMDRCQASIETISDDIQQLQACLAEEESKLEEERIDEITQKEEYNQLQEQMKAKREEEERKKEKERRKRFGELRDNVVRELISTEREYCRHLTLTHQAFGLDDPRELEGEGVDVQLLFGNIADVIKSSQLFLNRLSVELEAPAASGSPPESGYSWSRVGACFLAEADQMKTVYTEYCLCQERAEQALEKYEADTNIHKLIIKGLETVRSDISCFNLASILIKPVQRILKYPLILSQLLKYTEQDNPDVKDLQHAIEIMSEIASFINETKRKKDIVDKYRGTEDSTLTRRIGRINMHSIGKKSSRISQKFLNTLGFESMGRDDEFEDYERLFSSLSSSVGSLCWNLEKVREQLHQATVSHFNIAQNIADLYSDRQPREATRFLAAHSHILSNVWNQFNEVVSGVLLRRLKQLLDALTGPSRLIQKRNDKILDLAASSQRADKNKDSSRSKQLKDDLEATKTNYLALNSQLVSELPVLIQLSTEVYSDCIKEYILARKIFLGRATKQLLQLMDLPLVTGSSGDILEVFIIKHSLVQHQMGRFSFASKAFRPEDKKRGSSPGRSNNDEQALQTSSQRTYLRGKYAATKLYQVVVDVVPGDHLELNLRVGDVVGVIQQKDPMGNRNRWFCDNGIAQGFLDAAVLSPLGHSPESGDIDKTCQAPEDRQPRHSLDSIKPLQNQLSDGCHTKGKLIAVVAPYDEVNEDDGKKPIRPAPPVPVNKARRRDPEQLSQHSYEEIAAEELQSTINDLSPIYEEIPGGSRSSMSSGSGSHSPRGRFYYAVYGFSPEAEEKTMLHIDKGQVLRVLQVAGEWWYVEDRARSRGYVPATYLKPYTA